MKRCGRAGAAWGWLLATAGAGAVLGACESGGAAGSAETACGEAGGPPSARSLAPAATGEIRGTVNSRQWAMIPAGTVVSVQLVETRAGGAPSVVLAEEVIAQPRTVPVPFLLRFDPARIVAGGRYRVEARVEVNGRLRWISADTATTIGRAPGSRGEPVDVWVGPVGGR